MFKKQVHEQCIAIATQKCFEINKNIFRVQESLSAESKSSAGDKHETGRAMLQLEREKLGLQLKNAEQVLGVLQKINPTQQHIKATMGSLIKTENGYYYLSAFLGQIILEGKSIFVISKQSPIGSLIYGKSVGERFEFNNNLQTVLEVI